MKRPDRSSASEWSGQHGDLPFRGESPYVLCRQSIVGSDEQGRIYTVLQFAAEGSDDPTPSMHKEYSNSESQENLGHTEGISIGFEAQETPNMTTQDRYIDARLAGIESKLDARMDAMQRFQEKAEERFQRATERHETDIGFARQQIHDEFKGARKHATQVAIGTIAGVLAAFALVVAVAVAWIGDQGSYAQSYGENQVQMQQAADERAEFREAVKSIQATQQSILERLPPAEQSPSSQ